METINPDEIPDFIRDDTYAGPNGNSNDPRDSLWLGFDGKLDIASLLSSARDPTDALRQILEAIVQHNPSKKPGRTDEVRVGTAMAALLGMPQKRGPKPDPAKQLVLRKAAYLFYKKCQELGQADWKNSIWDALTEDERRRLGNDPEDEKFINFYRDLIPAKEIEDRLLFDASANNPFADVEWEPNLAEWDLRQERIDRVIQDLMELGIVKSAAVKSRG